MASLAVSGKSAILLRVAEHLRQIVFTVSDIDIGYISILVGDRSVDGVDEALIRSYVKSSIAVKHFFVELRVDLDCIGLHKVTACFIVTLALDTLHFGKKLAEEVAELGVVIDLDVCLAVALHHFNHIVGLTLFEDPC